MGDDLNSLAQAVWALNRGGNIIGAPTFRPATAKSQGAPAPFYVKRPGHIGFMANSDAATGRRIWRAGLWLVKFRLILGGISSG